MTRRFAAEIVTVLAHVLEHITIADGRARQLEADFLKIALESEIAHDRADDARLGQAPVFFPAFGDHRHQLVAVDEVTTLTDHHHPARIAIKREADIGAHFTYLAAQRFGSSRADLLV